MNRQNSPGSPAGTLRTYRTRLTSCTAKPEAPVWVDQPDERLIRSKAHGFGAEPNAHPVIIVRHGTSRLVAAERELAHGDSSKVKNNLLTFRTLDSSFKVRRS